VTITALVLVLVAAFLHATWNMLAKRTRAGLPFVWLAATIATVLWGPVAVITLLVVSIDLDAKAVSFLAGAAALHTLYYVSLQRSYRTGDLSLVYPVARGSGALLAVGGAVLLFAERPTPVSLVGALLITGGIFALADGARPLRGSATGRSVALALVTGGLICAYTLWDAHIVMNLAVPATLLVWSADAGRCLILAIPAQRRWPEVREAWSEHRREALGVAILSPLAYVLVLLALLFAPVSHVAPAREVSILIGVTMGHRLLDEGDVARRLLAGTAVVGGMVGVTVG
jgi:drug/metabolite transporter (DMT)-like permease